MGRRRLVIAIVAFPFALVGGLVLDLLDRLKPADPPPPAWWTDGT